MHLPRYALRLVLEERADWLSGAHALLGAPGPSTGTRPGKSGRSAWYTASGSVAVTSTKRALGGAAVRSGSTCTVARDSPVYTIQN